MADDPLRKRPVVNRSINDGDNRPKIWSEGDQRPPFDLRAFGRSSLHLSRQAVAPLHALLARNTRRVAANVKNGAGRIPEARLGRAARFVPSHLTVAGWVKTLAAVLSHASATADPDVKRGNALVAEIEPHLWATLATEPLPPAPEPGPPTADVAPVILGEPMHPDDDPLKSIRDDMAAIDTAAKPLSKPPADPPAPPGPVALMAIQMSGYALGWASSFVALPYGLARALWLHIKGVDLRRIGTDD